MAKLSGAARRMDSGFRRNDGRGRHPGESPDPQRPISTRQRATLHSLLKAVRGAVSCAVFLLAPSSGCNEAAIHCGPMKALVSPVSPGNAGLELKGLTHRFGSHTVLDNIHLRLDEGGVLALLGPSGCGKTTLLKLIAGMLAPEAGEIHIGGQCVAAPGIFQAPEKRGLGMVFQDYALWPHLSVGRNVSFPLEMRGVPRADCVRRSDDALALVGLAGFGSRQPGSLSGGQQQRVALARAIVARPRLLLFDEPLSNLDRDLRETLSFEIGRLLRELEITAVYVTHDQEEAFALADSVAVMQGGRICQHASPDTLVADPANAAVVDFLKLGAVVGGEATPRGWLLRGGRELAVPERAMPDWQRLAAGAPGHLFVPHAAVCQTTPDKAEVHALVTAQRYRNGHYATSLQSADLPGSELVFLSPQRFRIGEAVAIAFDWSRLRCFPVCS
jgi:iron(III) transport system ATP-binding protein